MEDEDDKKLPASVITNAKEEMKRIGFVTMAVWSSATSYILMMFIAMPLSIHLIINLKAGCKLENDEACFAPTTESQNRLTTILSALRISTFLMGCFLGALSDRIGRKPLLMMALLGYAIAGACYYIGWNSKSIVLFFIGAVVLGCVSPTGPTGIAYVSDISAPDRMAGNLGILQGIGIFFGLLSGALSSLAIGAATTGQKPTPEKTTLMLYDQMFHLSYGIGLGIVLLLVFIIAIGAPESLPRSMRKKLTFFNFILQANPFQTVFIFLRSKYLFFLWLSALTGYISAGANEAVTAGWWMRRYVIQDVASFFKFLVYLWLCSGIGAVVMTKIYIKCLGPKKATHFSLICTIIMGIALALARDVLESYIAVSVSFFASSALPTLNSLILQQVDVSERGALNGALRSSEALGKFIGIALMGGAFAQHIAPFTPPPSCIPATYGGVTGKINSCECGVRPCPVIYSSTNISYVPATCSLGQLSPMFDGYYSKYVQYKQNETHPIVPQALIDAKAVIRDETCLGSGGWKNSGGFKTMLPRVWCAGSSVVGPALNNMYGCPGFDIGQGTILKCLTDPTLYDYGIACYGKAIPLLQAYALASNETVALSPLTGPNTVACLANDATQCNMTIFRGFVAKYVHTLNMTTTTRILGRVLNSTFSVNEDGQCQEEGTVEFNLCWRGPISSFPGLFPLIYLAGFGLLSYICFFIGECFFRTNETKDNEFTKVIPFEANEPAKKGSKKNVQTT